MTDLAHTSVPAWAAAPASVPTASTARALLDPVVPGASYVLVGVGPESEPILADLAVAQPAATLLRESTDAEATEAMATLIAGASVGLRLVLVGSRGSCLRLRAAMVRAGLEDDEIAVVVTSAGALDVHCAHCGTRTTVHAEIGEVVRCSRCALDLVVYHHVSRRTGTYLGYQVDAETATVSGLEAAS